MSLLVSSIVKNRGELAREVGCKVGNLPTTYLGLPLGANHKMESAWDSVEERYRKRLALWKRHYISKGGRLTLLKSTLFNMSIYFFVAPADPKEGKNETGENSKGVPVGRRGPRKENSPFEVEDCLFQQGQGRLGC